MNKVALWRVGPSVLERVPEAALDLEKTLETWIENAPNLVQSDLVIVGRQLETEAGTLDLLGIDPQGRWSVIEIKRGALSRDAVAQVLDYASFLSQLDPEDPEARGRGIGATLHAYFLEYMRGGGARLARLSVSPSNAQALAYYGKQGWSDLGPRPDDGTVHLMEIHLAAL